MSKQESTERNPRPWLRWAVIIAALLLVSAFFLPLWSIELWAPQYPEGLYMTIWANKITGDVRNINILNHYIGMHPIEQDSFAEFRYFPIVIGGLVATGLLSAALNKRFLMRAWVLLLLIAAAAGAYDFWQWEYKFGHDLSPDAPIKVEGMAYQPPFIGVRSLLNISAWSLPGLAGYCILIAIVLAVGGLLLDVRGLRKKAKVAAASLATALMFGACSAVSASPIDFGKDSCQNCHMTITDRRYGGEVVLKKGKTYKFDSLECMFHFLDDHKEDLGAVYVLDSANGKLISAEKASFGLVPGTRSPMGEGILAAPDHTSLRQVAGESPSLKEMTWAEVTARIHGSSAH